MLRWNAVLIAGLLFAIPATGWAGASAPKKSSGVSKEIRDYNRGCKKLRQLDFAAAAKLFEKALDRREAFAEAHNNLAYALRKQGEAHYDRALGHYDRAVELDPGMAEAFMYRGVLHVQRGDLPRARADLARLEDLDDGLARELAWVLENEREKEPEQFFGVTDPL